MIGGGSRGQLFLGLLGARGANGYAAAFLEFPSSTQNMGPGWEPGAQMVVVAADNRRVVDMDNNQPEPEVVGRLTHTAAEAQDMTQPVLVVEAALLDLQPFVPQTRGAAYIYVYQIRIQHMIVLIG